MITLFGYVGIAGGLLCACGDLLLDIKGKHNQELGVHGYINSAWDTMDSRRFRCSILLAVLGVPMYFLGLCALSMLMAKSNPVFALVFWMVSLVGSIGGFFIHTFVCLMPLLYKTSRRNQDISFADELINTQFDAVKLPFVLLYALLVGVTSILCAIAIGLGYLDVPFFMIFCTPLSLTLIGVTLRRLYPHVFYDLPGIIMPSMGLAMLGLVAVWAASCG